MHVAVVGAGFSGLALAFHLLSKGVKVDLYDEKGVGAGASGVSSGLLHPYVGEQVRRSWKADEAMEETLKLLNIAQACTKDPVQGPSGFLRKVTPKQRQTFEEHAKVYQDVELVSDDTVRILSGIVVYSLTYLQGLYQACVEKGINLHVQKIHSACELEKYDAFILAIGAGVFSFPGLDHLILSSVKGQTLLCEWTLPPLKEALLGKGHIVPLPGGNRVHLGATYERGAITPLPDKEAAFKLLKPQAEVLAPQWREISVLECRAGVRVVRPAHARPWIYGLGEKGMALTAMGSRGLLYHAYYAKKIAETITTKDKEQWNQHLSF